MSDALEIARWAWPDKRWSERIDRSTACVWIDLKRSASGEFDVGRFDSLQDAELVLIERGLAEEYGQKLWAEVWDRPFGLGNGLSIARIATAPLDARVRAILAVIRAQEQP